MQSGQPGLDDRFGPNEPDNPAAIPDLARAWESAPQVVSSVRRPSTLPDPQSYHEVIETQAIFELDEKQKNGAIETILVVPFACIRCKLSLKQACSRAQPACVRCRKAGLSCTVFQGGYQRLPGPKFGRPPVTRRQSASGTGENSRASSSVSQGPPTVIRPTSRAVSLSQLLPSRSRRSTALGSKRSPSPGSDPVPLRKKKQAKNTSRNGRTRCCAVPASKETDTEWLEASVVGPLTELTSARLSTGERTALKWSFVKNSRGRGGKPPPEQNAINCIPSSTPIPRVWTNSLDGLLTVFPELVKTPVGFSWFQSETPVLFLDANYAEGRWLNSTTLSIDLSWDFSCHDFELESIVESDNADSSRLRSCQPAVHSPENTLDHEADTTDLQHSHFPPTTGLFPACEVVSATESTLNARATPSDGTLQHERYTCRGTYEYHAGGENPFHNATSSDSAPAIHSSQLYPSHSHSPPENPSPSHIPSALNGSPIHHTMLQANFQPRIPLNKPPEVDTLLDSRLRFIPLLLWISYDSGLVPCNLPPEYAYSCMGLFFISNLHHAVVQNGVSSTGIIQGRVCWSVTLQWAPGGEDALSDCNPVPLPSMILDSAPLDSTRDLLHPWWFDPTDTLSQADNPTPYRPRDLRMQIFSFIPLDLLADFHPSESFPRGWFCKSCGMINTQEFFRHQICQSAMCESARKKHVPQGKADSLSSLRDPYRSSTLIQPTNNIPSVVASDSVTWDDGMQSWIYSVSEGITLCHVFTGNQQHLQEDATILLERIQCEVLLRKEDPSSPYFTHSTRLSHPSDGSEATVPGGTPDCLRAAYYTLCDFVHRYGEMDRPRFGEVRMQAWVNSGSRRGRALRASKSPVVIHCLGAEVILKFTPNGGYKHTAEYIASGKGKGRAKDMDRVGSPPAEPRARPSRYPEQDDGNQIPFVPGPEADESSIVTEHVDGAIAAMDTVRQRRNSDTGDTPDLKQFSPGIEMARHEVVEQKPERVRKKNKVTKDKSKTSVPEISMTLVHGDCVILYGDNFELQVVRTGTTILVIGFPEET